MLPEAVLSNDGCKWLDNARFPSKTLLCVIYQTVCCWKQNIVGWICQYHGWQCPGFLSCQVISDHAVDSAGYLPFFHRSMILEIENKKCRINKFRCAKTCTFFKIVCVYVKLIIYMMVWIPLTKASDAELWCFLWSASEKKNSWVTIETPLIWEALAPIMTSL